METISLEPDWDVLLDYVTARQQEAEACGDAERARELYVLEMKIIERDVSKTELYRMRSSIGTGEAVA